MTKICTICHQEKDVIAFPKWKKRCRACCAERSFIYYYAHHAERTTYARTYQARQRRENPAQAHLKELKWRQAHREEEKARCRARGPVWRATAKAKNPERVRLINRQKAHARRAHLHQCSVNDLSPKQIQEILAAKKYRCDYCGKKSKAITIDHITAISKGGDNTLWNVTVACKRCNDSKGTGEPLTAVQPLLLTIAPARKKRKVS